MDNIARKSLVSRKNSQRKTFALSVLSASLILANTAVYAADESPFSRAPLHLLNPGQTEIRTQTITHTEGVSDYKVTTPYTTTAPNVKPNIMLYVDNSGSMLGNQGAASVLEFAQDGGLLSQYASMANWGLTWMNGKDTQHSWEYDFPSPTYFPNVSVSADQKRVRDAIAFMGTVDGITRMNNYATPMIGGYITAAENLTKSMNDNNRCAKNYLIAMTDGAANGGPQRGASGLGAYYTWYGPYTTGFIPINAILNQTQYVKKFFPTYPVDKRSPQYQFLCPRDQNDVNKGTGFCPDKYGLSEFVLYPYTGHAQAHWYYTAAGGEYMRNDGWRYIRNNADRGQWGDITQFPNNSDYSRAYWYSSTGLTGSAGTAYIAFTDASSSKDAPDMMRWLSKEWDSKDLRPDIKGKQTITTFTIGFGSDFGDNQKGQPHYELLKNGASDKPSDGKWFATAMDADGLKGTFKQIFDYIKQETEAQNNSFPPPQPFSSTSDGGTAQSSSTSGGTIKRQSYSTSTPGKVGSGLTTGYPDAMASLQLNEKLTGTELIFTKLDEFGKPVGDDEKGSYIGAKFDERRAMIGKGDGTAKWFETPNGWYNTDFGLKNNTNEYKDTLLPWIARYGTDSDIQTRAKAHNDYEVNPYRIRVATKEHDMGDVLDTGIVSIGNRTAEVGRTDPADNTGRKEFLLTAANDGLVYIFQNQKTANIADTPPYSLKLNYSPATMPRSTTTDTVASKFSKIAREDYSDSPDNPHLYLINGGITARGTDTGTLDNPRERQYFMAGNMGQGARGMYAINVGGKDLKTGFPVGIDAPQSSWLTSVPLFEASAKQDSAIGYTVGFPQIARVGSDVATSKNLATGISQAVFMGSGFAHPNVKDQETALYVYEALGKDVGTDNVGALTPPRKSGELIQKVTIGKTGGLATPAVLDVNQDGVADYAFAGDYEGNMYRFDLRDINHIPNPVKIYSAPAWNGQFPEQPIVAEPAISKLNNGQYVVIWGTGSDMYDADFDKKDVQGIFGIHQHFKWDDDLAPIPVISDSVPNRDDLLKQELSFIADGGGETFRMVTDNDIRETGNLKYKGWYIPLDTIENERVVVQPDELWGSVAVYSRFYKKQAATGGDSKFVEWNPNDPLANGWSKISNEIDEAAKNKGIESCILEKDDQTGADIKVGTGWSGWSSVNLSEVPNYTPSNPQQPAGNTDDCGVSVVTNGASKAEKRTCSYDYNETNVYQWSKVTPYQGGSAVIQLRAENGGRIIHKKNIGFQFLLNNADLGSYLYGTDSAYISSKIYPDSINTISIFSQNITDYSQNHAGQHRSGDDETLGNLTKQPIDCLQGKDNLGYIAGSEGYQETVKLGEVYCESPKVVRRISWREIF